jgi:prolipoprotein diacylglyceryltransferase
VIRFVIEFLRADPRGDILGLTSLTGLSTSQLISLPIAIVSLIILILRWRKTGVPEKTDPMVVSTTARA